MLGQSQGRVVEVLRRLCETAVQHLNAVALEIFITLLRAGPARDGRWHLWAVNNRELYSLCKRHRSGYRFGMYDLGRWSKLSDQERCQKCDTKLQRLKAYYKELTKPEA